MKILIFTTLQEVNKFLKDRLDIIDWKLIPSNISNKPIISILIGE